VCSGASQARNCSCLLLYKGEAMRICIRKSTRGRPVYKFCMYYVGFVCLISFCLSLSFNYTTYTVPDLLTSIIQKKKKKTQTTFHLFLHFLLIRDGYSIKADSTIVKHQKLDLIVFVHGRVTAYTRIHWAYPDRWTRKYAPWCVTRAWFMNGSLLIRSGVRNSKWQKEE
jgi:hypothetical protein